MQWDRLLFLKLDDATTTLNSPVICLSPVNICLCSSRKNFQQLRHKIAILFFFCFTVGSLKLLSSNINSRLSFADFSLRPNSECHGKHRLT